MDHARLLDQTRESPHFSLSRQSSSESGIAQPIPLPLRVRRTAIEKSVSVRLSERRTDGVHEATPDKALGIYSFHVRGPGVGGSNQRFRSSLHDQVFLSRSREFCRALFLQQAISVPQWAIPSSNCAATVVRA